MGFSSVNAGVQSIGTSRSEKAKVMDNVVGTWRLVRASSSLADGTVMPTPYGGQKGMGRVTLNADGRMMAVLCDGRPLIPEGEAREYTSYCGNFTFDGKQLITKVDAASDAWRMGTDQVRDVSFENGLMILRPPVRAYQSAPEQRVLYWEKIADV
jgi:hypothetical protein